MNCGVRPPLILWLLLAAALILPPARADEEYKFFDASGNEVVFPKNIPVHTAKQPGPWKDAAALHEPSIELKTRKYGLESVSILEVKIPHPMNPDKEGCIKAIYVLDKDGLIVGYKKFSDQDKKAEAEIWLNGNINYIHVCVLCSKHEMWRYEFALKP